MEITEFLFFILNIVCIASSLLLMWFFYKWNKDTEIFYTIMALVIYEILFFEIDLLFNKLILTILFIFIFVKIFYIKCEEIGKELREQERQKAIRFLELYNRKKNKKSNTD